MRTPDANKKRFPLNKLALLSWIFAGLCWSYSTLSRSQNQRRIQEIRSQIDLAEIESQKLDAEKTRIDAKLRSLEASGKLTPKELDGIKEELRVLQTKSSDFGKRLDDIHNRINNCR